MTWSQMAADPNIQPLLNDLQRIDAGFTEGDDFMTRYLLLLQNPRQFSPEVIETLRAYSGTPALEKLDTFIKAYTLRQTWKLDPILTIRTIPRESPSLGSTGST